MKKAWVAIILLTSCFPLVEASRTPVGSANDNAARGRGSIRFGEDEHGVGSFGFDVTPGEANGSMLFAAEAHHFYPDIVVRMNDIEDANISGHTIRFSGEGVLHDEPVFINVSAFDGEGTQAPDRFSIQCTNVAGELVLKARGELFVGDVVVGETAE